MKTAILSLPQGFGKSTVAPLLARHLGCAFIVEEWCAAMPVLVGALHLTNEATSPVWPFPAHGQPTAWTAQQVAAHAAQQREELGEALL